MPVSIASSTSVAVTAQCRSLMPGFRNGSREGRRHYMRYIGRVSEIIPERHSQAVDSRDGEMSEWLKEL